MHFHSLQFLLLMAVAFAGYWLVHRHKWARLSTLLAASILFYAAWSPYPILIFGWMATVDWLCVRGMARASPLRRKLLLTLSTVSNLGILSTFKYADLFASTVATLLGAVGVEVHYRPLGLILPIGLSFVAFQAISLVVDVYRGEVEPKHSLLEHLLYLMFFPQVVAGPIVRAKNLLLSFDKVPTLHPDDGAEALFRVALGVTKKLLIADILGVGLVDRPFDSPEAFTSAECAVAIVAYTFEIYFDFSAYSDIAIGAAALFGFHIPENFNKPYLARNLFEFWNRWHISLSTWLRDYLYIPLGGNRVSRPRILLNLMIVMALGGLWHGADWRFALWGGIHGVGLMATRVWWWILGGRPKAVGLVRAGAGLAATLVVVMLTRIVFRAADLPHAAAMVEQLLKGTWGLANVSPVAAIALGVAILAHYLPVSAFTRSAEVFARLPVPVRAMLVVGLGLAIRAIGGVEVRPYIYFQF